MTGVSRSRNVLVVLAERRISRTGLMAHLAGKAIVITGSGRGIGAACARSAARHGAGVVVNDLDAGVTEQTTQEIIRAGGRAVAHSADITDAEQARKLIERCVSEFGAIDGLVNNAGVSPRGDLVDLDVAQLRRTLEINVVGAALCGAAAARLMVPRGQGSIINVLSGAQCGIPNLGVYGASKGALASFTYSWAMELQSKGIRVNALAPTSTATRLMDDYMAAGGGPGRTRDPLPAEVNAPPIVFLLSDESEGITGQVLRFDGERVTLMAHPAVLEPWVSTPEGSVEDIVEAFRTSLGQRQVPLGIVGVTLNRL
jgi:NAD(P)-dependent dehydrogenase (short-subunit alcohol dehydrogenase family)